MEPFPATAISTLCVTSGKILLGFYEYINDVADVPRYVEELTAELSSLNAALLALKALLLPGAVRHMRRTLKQIEDCVNKSKIKTNKSAKGQLLTCISWLWNKEVVLLRQALAKERETISFMLQVSTCQSQDDLAKLLKQVDEKVTALQESRKHVKEALVVIDRDHPRFEEAEFTIHMQPATRPDEQPAPAEAPSPFRPLNRKLVDTIEAKAWTAAKVICDEKWTSVPQLSEVELRIKIISGRSAMLALRLSSDDDLALPRR
ncbi:hypothetical protein B0T26DRAFT_677206 [Lasiosphaeria miniovina]|uniref:Fungal N-terminal domain-containing protein n=1 Tax=Lasiosphaeria miniovina TaxID=1954250 RepID=A0AA40ABH9_9PEZI|nr:uncharacterized protein B0T26DRAFT_677206 [Lasiosphaeria miniovina]KAK0712787.1 hypothetical protein B0T26DRAFT_677206 [Lasiosphaeria miniovina]